MNDEGSQLSATDSVGRKSLKSVPKPSTVPQTGTVNHLPHQSAVCGADGATIIPANERLANFYRKYNKLLLDNISIAKEKERLQLENLQLQDLITQYLNGTKLSDDTLAEDNPLFVVNGRYI